MGSASARAVLRQAEVAVAGARNRRHAPQLPATIELIRQVLAQTRARVLHGDTHYPSARFVVPRDRWLSLGPAAQRSLGMGNLTP